MSDIIGDIIGDLIFGLIGAFFRATRWLGIVYVVIAIGAGLFLWSRLYQSLGDTGGALSCVGVVLVLLGVFAFLHIRLFRRA